QSEAKRSALATVVEVKGSAYRRAGARMLLAEDGRSAGMINGGCLDGDLWGRAHEVMESGRAVLTRYDTTSNQDIVFGLGLGCRGVVKILIEPANDLTWLAAGHKVAVVYEGEDPGTRLIEVAAPQNGAFIQNIEAPQRLLIFGAGADVVPLHAMAKLAGFRVEVFDSHAPSPNRIPLVPSIYHPIEKLEAHLKIDSETACVVMTHNFLFDLELLKLLLPSPARYVGILGPRRRADELLEKIGRDTLLPGIDLAAIDLRKLHAPIGLDIGAETPEEIALSILAEIQKMRRDKSGLSLREKESIH
ncbi:MAG: XdhC family protein, partial [Armatimonadetes bacterium]|nr:XdhC family protein [Armatimonadota bacterium]